MMLAHPAYSLPMQITEEAVSVLAVEAPELLREMILDFSRQLDGADGMFVLSEEYCPIGISGAVCLIRDPLRPDLSSRRILNALLHLLAANAENEGYYVKTQAFRAAFARYLWELSESVDIPLAFREEPDILAILKAAELRPSWEEASPADALCGYMALVTELNLAKLFVFINLKSYFSLPELEAMYADFRYRKYRVLLLESSDRPDLRHLENTILIDRDMCEVINENI